MSPQPRPTPSLAEVYDTLRRYAQGACPDFHRNLNFGWEDLDGQKTRIGVPLRGRQDEPSTQLPALAPTSTLTHSADFRCVTWLGVTYSFTPTQASVVQVLWEARENGSPEMGQAAVLEAAGSECGRLLDLFRRSPAWGALIVPGRTAGSYRLATSPGESAT